MGSGVTRLPKINPRVFFDMTVAGKPVGRIEMELYAPDAPAAVENFVDLCNGGCVGDSGNKLHYKGSVFHSVIPGYMCQGGDITHGNGTGGETVFKKPFRDEINRELQRVGRGVLYMCNGGPDSNTSQFIISLKRTPWLNRCHTVFGRVVKGLDVLKAIEEVGSRSGTTTAEVKIADCGEL
jgi:peptidylprolyl isomerase